MAIDKKDLIGLASTALDRFLATSSGRTTTLKTETRPDGTLCASPITLRDLNGKEVLVLTEPITLEPKPDGEGYTSTIRIVDRDSYPPIHVIGLIFTNITDEGDAEWASIELTPSA